jgi:hypothetical protein
LFIATIRRRIMGFDTMSMKLTWKRKIIFVFLAVLGLWMIKGPLFGGMIGENGIKIIQFKTNFEQQRSEIHNESKDNSKKRIEPMRRIGVII